MDEYNLKRFIKAQNECFEYVYEELKSGKKQSHWMWFIFPQLFGLGKSEWSIYYAIKDSKEAKAYLENDLLRERLNLLVETLLNLETNDATKIFGFPDNLKFWSSMTLFNYVKPEEELYKKALDKFFQGRLELASIEILKREEN